jgi:hypothetical protein
MRVKSTSGRFSVENPGFVGPVHEKTVGRMERETISGILHLLGIFVVDPGNGDISFFVLADYVRGVGPKPRTELKHDLGRD